MLMLQLRLGPQRQSSDLGAQQPCQSPYKKQICKVQGRSALHTAVLCDQISLVEELLSQGANINAVDEEARDKLPYSANFVKHHACSAAFASAKVCCFETKFE